MVEKLIFHLLTLHNFGHYIFRENRTHSIFSILPYFLLRLRNTLHIAHTFWLILLQQVKDFYKDFYIPKQQLDLLLFFSHVFCFVVWEQIGIIQHSLLPFVSQTRLIPKPMDQSLWQHQHNAFQRLVFQSLIRIDQTNKQLITYKVPLVPSLASQLC